MNHPQVVVREPLRRLAQHLRDALTERSLRWAVREPRDAAACLAQLRTARPGVLVVHLGADPAEELGLLERAAWLFPAAATVAVHEHDNPALAALAWDVGATHVLVPLLSRDLFVEVVVGLMPHA